MTAPTPFATGSLLDVPFGEWGRLLDLPPDQLYRVRQIQEWVFARRASGFAEMTTLPQELRRRLAERFALRALTLARRETSALDDTTRLFFETADGKQVSAVFLPSGRPPAGGRRRPSEEGGGPSETLPAGDHGEIAPEQSPEDASRVEADAKDEGEDEPRYSLCVSTQVGCAWGCVFCASGRVRFRRNLLPSEMLDQLILAERATGKKVGSLLFMGMGEPLANYNHLLWTLQCLRSPLAFHYGARHVTVSTSGLVPQIFKLAEEAPKVNLAVSLHAADDATRRRLLPKSGAWPIKDLLKAAWAYQKKGGGGRVTFEYILLKGVNDSLRSAQRLSNLLRHRKAWVNLIAYNPVAGLSHEKPAEETARRFARVLSERGIFVRLRKPQGADIAAGCGQLGAPGPVRAA